MSRVGVNSYIVNAYNVNTNVDSFYIISEYRGFNTPSKKDLRVRQSQIC